MRTVLLDGNGAVGLAAYRRLVSEGATVVVNAPPGDILARVAAGDGRLVDSATATFVGVFANEIVEADGPWPVG